MSSELRESVNLLIESLESVGRSATFGPSAVGTVTAVGSQLALSGVLEEYYRDIGPVTTLSLPWTVERVRLFSLSDLLSGQEGYRMSSGQRLRNWEDGWIVIGERSGDPFIANVSDPKSPISYAIHGVGEWVPAEIAGSLSDFFRLLATFVDVLINSFQRDVWDDSSGELRGDFKQELAANLAFLPQKNLRSFLDSLE